MPRMDAPRACAHSDALATSSTTARARGAIGCGALSCSRYWQAVLNLVQLDAGASHTRRPAGSGFPAAAIILLLREAPRRSRAMDACSVCAATNCFTRSRSLWLGASFFRVSCRVSSSSLLLGTALPVRAACAPRTTHVNRRRANAERQAFNSSM